MSNDPITTTAKRVKSGGYWCEDATAITQAALDRSGYTWDTEIDINWGFENLGLSNTILALGSVRPRFQPRADRIVLNLMREIYRRSSELAVGQGISMHNTALWLGNPYRVGARKTQFTMFQELLKSTTDVGVKSILHTLMALFSTHPNHVICIHASKLLLASEVAINGMEHSKTVRLELINFIKQELAK